MRPILLIMSNYTTEHLQRIQSVLSEFIFGEEDIIEAIDAIGINTATSEGEIPARILKGCKVPLETALKIIWKLSFEQGKVPGIYKHQYVTPIFKGGEKIDPANYRPVSLTSHMIKIFERIITKYLVKYFEERDLFYSRQHGFRKGKSCLTQLLQHQDAVLKNYLEGAETDVIYLDYSKAFDKVDHQLLMKKLRFYGISGKLHNWIADFLRNRIQRVVVDGIKSEPMKVVSGVPKGTVLVPILFLIYLNDIGECVESSTLNSFADDTRISRKIENINDCRTLQTELINSIQWATDNNMALNEEKFERMSFRTPKNRLIQEALPFMKDIDEYTTEIGTVIHEKQLIRDLGIHVSENYSWTPHINIMVDNAQHISSWVLGVFQDRSIPVMLQLFKSLSRPRVEYCCPLWNPLKIGDIQTVESVQREFTRRIEGMAEISYWERLKRLKLQSLQRRRERYIIIHVWKIINNETSNDLQLRFKRHHRLGNRAITPSLNKGASRAALTSYESSFAVRGCQLWNTLPAHVNSKTTLEAFKTVLGKHMDSIVDQPPTPGYVTVNSNSILDWRNQKGGPQTA